MIEAAPPSRRRERSRGARSTGPSLAPLPRMINRMPPVEVLTEEQVERILAAAFRIMEEGGLEIRSARAREIYRRHGADVDEATHIVRLRRDIVEASLAHAPEQFVLRARNRAPDRLRWWIRGHRTEGLPPASPIPVR